MASDDFPVAQYLIEESTALRGEIVKSEELEFQLFCFTIAIAGTVYSLGLGLPVEIGQLLLLLYPFLVLTLAARWVHANKREHQIGNYIRDEIEPNLKGLGWETYLQRQIMNESRKVEISLQALAARTAFAGTQIVAMVLAVYRGDQLSAGFSSLIEAKLPTFSDGVPLVFFLLDIVTVGVTFGIIYSRRKSAMRGITKSQ